jgi:hypothetical protein
VGSVNYKVWLKFASLNIMSEHGRHLAISEVLIIIDHKSFANM